MPEEYIAGRVPIIAIQPYRALIQTVRNDVDKNKIKLQMGAAIFQCHHRTVIYVYIATTSLTTPRKLFTTHKYDEKMQILAQTVANRCDYPPLAFVSIHILRPKYHNTHDMPLYSFA